MKKTPFKIAFSVTISILLLIITFLSCKKETDLGQAPRLFRPTVKGELVSTGNFIEASWQEVKSAASYTVEISRDTFKTIDLSVDVDSTSVLMENLEWDQLYQVQVRANAPDSVKNSKFGTLGEVKTPRFPSIVEPATINDVTETSAIMRWTNSGAAVTEIKVFSEPARSLIKTVTLTATDITNQFKVVTGLSSATSYYIELYSGTTLRGYNTYTTKSVFEGQVIDLTNILDKPSILQDTILDVPSGSLILLKKGLTYNITSAISLSKTVTIASGDDLLVPEPANIHFTGNLDFVAGSTIDSISFENVKLTGADYAGTYVLNGSASATVGKIKFNNCKAEIFRGLIRLKGGTTTISNYEINNCIIDSISGYGLLTVDAASCKVENIHISNSTVYKAEKLIASSKQASNSVSVENCTFNEAPLDGTYLIDYNTMPVTAGIKILNNIFGIAKDKSGSVKAKGVRANGIIDASNNYTTSDYVNSADPIPNVIPYERPSTDIFESPKTGDFTIKDLGFPGKSSAGDPRWRL